jgi:hypothetical protein
MKIYPKKELKMNKEQLLEEFFENIVQKDLTEEENYKLVSEHIENLNILCGILNERISKGGRGGGKGKGKGKGGREAMGTLILLSLLGGGDGDDAHSDKIKYEVPKREYAKSETGEHEKAATSRRGVFRTRRRRNLSTTQGKRQGRQGGTK